MNNNFLPLPQKIPENIEMWVDEAIWGHRLYDEQTPWLTLLEFLGILQSQIEVNKGFKEEENQLNNLKYYYYPRLYLRNLLFNNPYLESISNQGLAEEACWKEWEKIMINSCGGINQPVDFSYLRKRFASFKDFVKIIHFFQSNATEGDSNKRWTSKFVFPYGADCLYSDLRVTGTNFSQDRRFFARTGELLYLMLCRSGKGSELKTALLKLGIVREAENPDQTSKWNRIIKLLQPEFELTHTREGGNPPYLPYKKLTEYKDFADDWLRILNYNLPDYDAIPYLVTLTGLHLIIYLLSRAKAVLENEESPQFILEIIAPKKTVIRDLASTSFLENNNFSHQAVQHYIRSITKTTEWDDCKTSPNFLEDTKTLLKEKFAWDGDTANSPDEMLDELCEQAISRHKKHIAKCHSSWAKEIGLVSSRGSRRLRYAPSDSLLKTVVLSTVEHRLEFQQFLAKLSEKYGFIIGDRQATKFIEAGEADQEAFKSNAERLEARLASLGLLKRLSDACAYVQNPFAVELV
ncbi:hypothetical protein [Planktothrix paucivesiculata]|uniref:Uncharacterized protein n=1 Tax=Planktothrix paucivesiculata PCC 9631 TaxID=671071 RepID=A0A7Z9E506_9CYAN|nr:hypothetical protein [Planktothrix paucivesiculata]VXD25928.1 conserved hypothetical protein [Planktothrix paucivesiculata PCC 9631]